MKNIFSAVKSIQCRSLFFFHVKMQFGRKETASTAASVLIYLAATRLAVTLCIFFLCLLLEFVSAVFHSYFQLQGRRLVLEY